MKIYFVRHTKPDIAPGICYGQADIGLDADFERDKELVKQLLPRLDGAIYSSPLKRCLQLANFLDETRVVVDHRLMEISFGEWELVSWNEIDQSKLIEWGDNFVENYPPGGENFMDVMKRAIHFYTSILEKSDENAVVVTHGGVMRAILVHLLEMPAAKAFVLKVPYGCVLEITTDGDKFCEIRWLSC